MSVPELTATSLAKELVGRELVLMGVGFRESEPRFLVVYLHGPAGQWAKGYAREIISGVPGVLSAVVSESSPTIVIAEVAMQNRE